MARTHSTTDQLIQILSSNNLSSVAEAMASLQSHKPLPPLKDYLYALVTKQNQTPAWLFQQAGLERTAGYRILSGSRMSGRNVLIRFALVLHLSLPESQQLLKIGNRAPLYSRVRRDALLIYAIAHRMSLLETEDTLLDMGEKSLYEKV